MKNYKQILEAVNRGIQLALDDFNDEEEPIKNLKSKQAYNRDYTKEYLDLMKEVVDLGLPSGTLWCKYNLGATCEPNNNKSWFGNYYAWGELESNKKKYDWDHYKFYDGPDTKAAKIKIDIRPEYYITKYTNLAGIEKQLKELLPEDDAAFQSKKIHSFKFHIPTKEQAQELLDNTKKIYVKDVSENPKYENAQGYTGAGWFMISKINGNYIFFPEAGIKDGDGISLNKIDFGIWTSSVDNTNCAWAIKLYPSFNQERCSPLIYGFWKYEGLPIRPVINL